MLNLPFLFSMYNWLFFIYTQLLFTSFTRNKIVDFYLFKNGVVDATGLEKTPYISMWALASTY